MPEPMKDLLDRLGEQAMECRELIREMHGLQKDIRLATRDANEAIKLAREVTVIVAGVAHQAINQDISEILQTSVHHHVQIMGDAIKEQVYKSMHDINDEVVHYSRTVMDSLGPLEAIVEKRNILEDKWQKTTEEHIEFLAELKRAQAKYDK